MTPQITQEAINLFLGLLALIIIFILGVLVYIQKLALNDANEIIDDIDEGYMSLVDDNIKLERENKALETMVNNLKNNK